jgi:hypothetical protein
MQRQGRGVSHPHSSSAKVEERVELYLYSPSMLLCKGVGRPLLLHFEICEEASRIENLRSSVFKEQHITRPDKR